MPRIMRTVLWVLSATQGALERHVVDWDEVQMEREALVYVSVQHLNCMGERVIESILELHVWPTTT